MYRPFFSATVALFLFAGRVFAQTPIPFDTVTLPLPVVAVARSAPSVADCVCRVVAGVGPGTWSAGSGTNVRRDGLVLTNEHVVGSKLGRKITLHFRSGKEYVGEVVAADRADDVAAVAFKPDADTPYTVTADTFPAAGESVWTVGYPRGKFTTRFGPVRGYFNKGNGSGMDWINVDTWIGSGDSGGGVFDSQGCLVGVQGHSFAGTDRCLACDLRPIRRILGRCPGGKCPPAAPPKPGPAPGDVPPPPPPKTEPGEPVKGDKGDKGDIGPAGPAGTVIDGVKPLTCELFDVDGTLIQRVEFWPGQPLRIKLKPVPVAAPKK